MIKKTIVVGDVSFSARGELSSPGHVELADVVAELLLSENPNGVEVKLRLAERNEVKGIAYPSSHAEDMIIVTDYFIALSDSSDTKGKQILPRSAFDVEER